MQRTWIALGALAGLTAVAMAAVAAHGLGGLDPAAVAMVRSGIEMQGWHALALLACGLWAPRGGKAGGLRRGRRSRWVWCCSAARSMRWRWAACGWGWSPPVGGTLLMVGWALLGLSAVIAARKA